MKVCFVDWHFPHVATFVAQEMRALKEAGVPIVILPIRFHSSRKRQPIFDQLQPCVHRIPPFGLSSLFALLHFVFRDLKRTVRVFHFLLPQILRPSKEALYTLAIIPFAFACARYVQNNRITHVHATWAHYPATVAHIVNTLTDVPYSFSAHAGADIYRSNPLLSAKLHSARFCITCVAGNLPFLRSLTSSTLESRIFHVSHGVDLSFFRYRGTRRRVDINHGVRLLSVGSLHKPKGFQHMISACRLLADKGVLFSYTIVGTGYYLSKLQEQVVRLKLSSSVHFVGQLLHTDLIRYYMDADIFIMPSVVLPSGGRDGIPNVVIEAMSVGVPVIASKSAGLPEVVFHEVTGLLVEPGQPIHLCDAVLRLLHEHELRERIVKNARTFIERRFDVSTNSFAFVDVLVSQISGGKPFV